VTRRFDVVVVGTSTGGLDALSTLLAALPPHYNLPISVVQHRSKDSDEQLANLLQLKTAIPVREAEDKEPLVGPGVFLAPADYHLMIERGSLALSTDAPVGYSRPSIDVLFESAADAYGAGVIGVLLTGANHDGTRGLQRIKGAGGFVIVQDPNTAESSVMPRNSLGHVQADRVLTLVEIADELARLATKSQLEGGAE
jgi:two-component system chemotaxis response regulator CheB